jgi:TPR repeat protein
MTLDMRPEDRARLEAALAQGVVGVSYDCNKLQVLPDCVAPGAYTYLGLSRKAETLELAGAQELSANLPFAGLAGELTQGTSLRADMVVIGRRSATVGQLDVSELRGNCAAATHFVRATSVGAYSLKTVAQAEARAGAGHLGASVEGGAGSAKHVLRSDGEPKRCEAATLTDREAPAGCGAIVHLELAPIGRTPATVTEGIAQPAVASWHCSGGTRWNGQYCAREGEGDLCGADNIQACVAQCEAGRGVSCTDLGFFYWVGRLVGQDKSAAVRTWQRGCDLGDADSCENVGIAWVFGQGTRRDVVQGVSLLRTACGQSPSACRNLGVVLSDGDLVGSPDYGAARSYLQRACDGGEFEGCRNLAELYEQGQGVPRDAARSRQLLDYACRAGDPPACRVLGARLHDGSERSAGDPSAARVYFERGCHLGEPSACALLGLYYMDGLGGLPRDGSRGEDIARRACDKHASGCVVLAVYYERQGDSRRAVEFRRRACDLGDENACKKLR